MFSVISRTLRKHKRKIPDFMRANIIFLEDAIIQSADKINF